MAVFKILLYRHTDVSLEGVRRPKIPFRLVFMTPNYLALYTNQACNSHFTNIIVMYKDCNG